MDKYIRAAFDELLNEDGLTVFAKGMGVQRLLTKFLHYYSMMLSPSSSTPGVCMHVCLLASNM